MVNDVQIKLPLRGYDILSNKFCTGHIQILKLKYCFSQFVTKLFYVFDIQGYTTTYTASNIISININQIYI